MVLFGKFGTLIYIKAPSPHFGGSQLITHGDTLDEAKSTTQRDGWADRSDAKSPLKR